MVTISKYENGFMNSYYESGAVCEKRSERVYKKYNQDGTLMIISRLNKAKDKCLVTEFKNNELITQRAISIQCA